MTSVVSLDPAGGCVAHQDLLVPISGSLISIEFLSPDSGIDSVDASIRKLSRSQNSITCNALADALTSNVVCSVQILAHLDT